MVGCGVFMARRIKTFSLCLVLALAFAALSAAVASASVISDCTDNNSLDGNYSASALKNALQNVPADVDQYYGCSDLIRQELLNKAAPNVTDKGGKGGGADLNAAATDEQRKQAERKVEQAVNEAMPHGKPVAPGQAADIERTGAKTLASTAAPGTPIALIVALIGLLLLFAGELVSRRSSRGEAGGDPTDSSD